MEKLRQAFALAHRQSQNDELNSAVRCQFRAIQHLIWEACGCDPCVPVEDRDAEDITAQEVRP